MFESLTVDLDASNPIIAGAYSVF
jgi:hypothetical protein